jgi:serine/threonine protein kinase/tetratricopeptide (TPR) repeat protein
MIGSTLGPYRLDRELGAGGMGTVWRATLVGRGPGIDAGTVVALKVIHPHLLETPGFFKRFLREADVGRRVAHENVVRTYDADALLNDGKQLHFIVMEYVEGQTLRALSSDLGRVPEQLCRHIGREVAVGLAAIHAAGVVHRDMKPENVLITEGERVKVMDLGVAQLQDEVIRLSQTGSFVGSVLYAAPEQFGAVAHVGRGAGPLAAARGGLGGSGGGASVDARADLYALGLTLYELATGVHPFAGDDLRVAMRRQLAEDPRPAAELNPQLTPFFEEVLRTLLAKDREKRFATAGELASVLGDGEGSAWWKERARALRVETKRPLRRIRIPRETAIHGRDEEIAKLRRFFEHAKKGEGRVVLVEGEAGIGKTRLVDEFVGRLQQEGEDLNFLFGTYPPGGAATAAGAFSTAYREHFGAEGLEETLRPCLTVTPGLVAAFAALLRGEATPRGEDALTKDSLQSVFLQATRALGAERPTIVLIDDLHFAPEEGLALFAALAAGVAEHRVLLVGTMRPGVSETWVAAVDRHEHGERIVVPRLGAKDLARLLVEAFTSERLAHELSFEVAAKSDGNPFFVFEIIGGLREGKFITRGEDGTWVRTRVIGDIKIPSSVLDLIQARISELSEEERNLLEVAACCGFEFDPLLVGDVLGMGPIQVLQRLGRLEKTHRLVRSVGRRCAFDHHQVQEALYGGVAELLREQYHAAIGTALETREKAATRDPATLDGAVATSLCEHFLKGGRAETAVRYLDAALAHLQRAFLHDAVVRMIDRAVARGDAVDTARRIALLQVKARALYPLGRTVAQEEALGEAMRIAAAELPSGLARVQIERAMLFFRTGRFEQARHASENALELARAAGDRTTESSAAGTMGHVLAALGRHHEMLAIYEDRVAFARASQDTAELSNALNNLGDLLWSLGHVRECFASLEEGVQIARTARHRVTEAMALGNLGGVRATAGALSAAVEALETALVAFRETGHVDWEAFVLHEIGGVAERRGDLDGAARRFDESLRIRREVRNEGEVAETLVALGRVRLAQNRSDLARAPLEEALRTSRNIDQAFSAVLAAAYLARLPGGDASVASETFAKFGARVPPRHAIEARFVLWQVTGDRAHLDEAARLLAFLVEHAPPDLRAGVVANVPLHRAIAAAARAAELGGTEPGTVPPSSRTEPSR